MTQYAMSGLMGVLFPQAPSRADASARRSFRPIGVREIDADNVVFFTTFSGGSEAMFERPAAGPCSITGQFLDG
jgi:hypothetical protein